MSFRFVVAAALLAALLVPTGAVLAQDGEEEELEPGKWHYRLHVGLNMAQAAYSDNWRGGENNNLAWTANLITSAQRRYHNGINWATRLQLRFGQTHQQREIDGESEWERPEKTEDKIDLESVALLEKGWRVDPYLSGRYQSQFLDLTDPHGREQPLNPMIFQESAGIARHLIERENEFMLARLGWTQRQNFRRNYVDIVGDATENSWTHDGGLELQVDWNLKVLKDKVQWISKASAYQPLGWSETSTFDQVSADSLTAAGIAADVTDLATTVDVRWENTFDTQITKWITFSFYLEFRYDRYDNSVAPVLDPAGDQILNQEQVQDAITDGWQWKQTFGIGISYRLH